METPTLRFFIFWATTHLQGVLFLLCYVLTNTGKSSRSITLLLVSIFLKLRSDQELCIYLALLAHLLDYPYFAVNKCALFQNFRMPLWRP